MSQAEKEKKYANFYREIEKFSEDKITIQELSSQFTSEDIYEILDNSIVISMMTLSQIFQIFQVTLNHVYFMDVILNGEADPSDHMKEIVDNFNKVVDSTLKALYNNMKDILDRGLFLNDKMKKGYEQRMKDLIDMYEDRNMEE